jgi:hypothetical protein
MIPTINKKKTNRTQTSKQDKALAEATLDRLVDGIVTGRPQAAKSPKGSSQLHRSRKGSVPTNGDN